MNEEYPIDDPHQANRAFWNASTEWWKEREDQRGLWMRAHQEPRLVLREAEMRYVADIQGVEVCVLGSGDNEVAFALAGLGGRVTSVDISERRLAVAADRTRTLDLPLRFVQADVTDLSVLADDSFGLVYTGGHVSVWVADIQQYYAEAGRILVPGGLFVANEYHPMRRMWEDADNYEPRYRYLDRGPHRSSSTFEYHWTVADHVQATINGGCRIVEVVEYGEQIEDEQGLEKMPAHLLIVGQKEGSA